MSTGFPFIFFVIYFVFSLFCFCYTSLRCAQTSPKENARIHKKNCRRETMEGAATRSRMKQQFSSITARAMHPKVPHCVETLYCIQGREKINITRQYSSWTIHQCAQRMHLASCVSPFWPLTTPPHRKALNLRENSDSRELLFVFIFLPPPSTGCTIVWAKINF